jgi:hypothetical protein
VASVLSSDSKKQQVYGRFNTKPNARKKDSIINFMVETLARTKIDNGTRVVTVSKKD